jgi:hypothetical protein
MGAGACAPAVGTQERENLLMGMTGFSCFVRFMCVVSGGDCAACFNPCMCRTQRVERVWCFRGAAFASIEQATESSTVR